MEQTQNKEEEEEEETYPLTKQTKLTSSTLKEVLTWEEYERQDYTSFPLQIQSLVRVGRSGTDEVWVWFGIWNFNLTELCFSNTKGDQKIKDFVQGANVQKRSIVESRH